MPSPSTARQAQTVRPKRVKTEGLFLHNPNDEDDSSLLMDVIFTVTINTEKKKLHCKIPARLLNFNFGVKDFRPVQEQLVAHRIWATKRCFGRLGYRKKWFDMQEKWWLGRNGDKGPNGGIGKRSIPKRSGTAFLEQMECVRDQDRLWGTDTLGRMCVEVQLTFTPKVGMCRARRFGSRSRVSRKRVDMTDSD